MKIASARENGDPTFHSEAANHRGSPRAAAARAIRDDILLE